jgi:hypothetical protein
MTSVFTATITTAIITGVQFHNNSVCSDIGRVVSGLAVDQLFAVIGRFLQNYQKTHRIRFSGLGFCKSWIRLVSFSSFNVGYTVWHQMMGLLTNVGQLVE